MLGLCRWSDKLCLIIQRKYQWSLISNRELPILENLLLLDVLCALDWRLFAVELDGYFGATLGGSLSNSYLHLKNSQFWPLVLLFFHALSDPGFSEWCDYLTSCIVESTRIKPKYFFFFSGPLLQYEARSTNMRNRHMRTTRPIAWSFDILLSSSSSINRRWAGPS